MPINMMILMMILMIRMVLPAQHYGGTDILRGDQHHLRKDFPFEMPRLTLLMVNKYTDSHLDGNEDPDDDDAGHE